MWEYITDAVCMVTGGAPINAAVFKTEKRLNAGLRPGR